MIIQGSMRYSPSGRKRKTSAWKKKKGAVAQTGERRTCTAKVAGSTPVSSTSKQYPSLPTGKYTPAKDNSWKVEASKKFTVAPAYNKGAYQVIPRDDVEHIGK